MKKNNYFIKTLFDIFGYAVVGMLSFAFGLVLQNYNMSGSFFPLLIEYNQIAAQVYTIIIIQILLICLFGHSYAVSILPRKDIPPNSRVYEVVGNWLETLFVCVIVFVGMYNLYNPNTCCRGFWITSVLSIAIYSTNCIYYRIKVKTDEFDNNSFHVLFMPAILMVGVNIYLGSSIVHLLNNEWWFYIPLLAFFLYYLFLYVCKNKTFFINVFFVLVVVAFGAITMFEQAKDIILPMRNIFLAVMSSIFLSIFEGWYVIFRQLNGKNNKEELAEIITCLIIAFPAIICILYPIQQFNFIYFITSLSGTMVAQFIWLFYVYPSRELTEGNEGFNDKKKWAAIWRAVLGILTLAFLMLDKYLVIETPLWLNKDSFIFAGFALEVAFEVIKKFLCEKLCKLNVENKYIVDFFKWRIIAYSICVPVLFIEHGFLRDLNKVNMSGVAILASSFLEIVSLGLFYWERRKKI